MRDPLVLFLVFVGLMGLAIFFGPRLCQRPRTSTEQIEAFRTAFEDLAHVISTQITPIFQQMADSIALFAGSFEQETDTSQEENGYGQ